MRKKVWVLLTALAIVSLSVSVVSAVKAYTLNNTKKIYVSERLTTSYPGRTTICSFEGWVRVNEDGSYIVPLFDSSGRYSGICIYHKNENDIGEVVNIDFAPGNGPWQYIVEEPTVFSGTSIVTAVSGIACLGIVVIRKRRGMW